MARMILGNVKKLAKKVEDVVTIGERVVDTLQLLEKMKGNFDGVGADNAVVDRWRSAARRRLVEINEVIEGFGKKGWMKWWFGLRQARQSFERAR